MEESQEATFVLVEHIDRLRNDQDDVRRELLDIKCQLQRLQLELEQGAKAYQVTSYHWSVTRDLSVMSILILMSMLIETGQRQLIYGGGVDNIFLALALFISLPMLCVSVFELWVECPVDITEEQAKNSENSGNNQNEADTFNNNNATEDSQNSSGVNTGTNTDSQDTIPGDSSSGIEADMNNNNVQLDAIDKESKSSNEEEEDISNNNIVYSQPAEQPAEQPLEQPVHPETQVAGIQKESDDNVCETSSVNTHGL